jgi:uncharacterized protein (TIGR03067 family)
MEMNMRRSFVLILTCAFTALAAAQNDSAKEESAKLQGTWVRIYVDVDGKKTDDGKKKSGEAVTLVVKGDKFGDDTFKLDPTKNPKHIDLAIVDDKGKSIPWPGIYELKGDELKVCFPYPFEGKLDKIAIRPTAFGSKRGGNEVLEVYKREAK